MFDTRVREGGWEGGRGGSGPGSGGVDLWLSGSVHAGEISEQ